MNRKQLAAAILLCVPATGFFNVLPVFLGAAAEDFGLTPDKVGFLSAVETGALAFASLLGPFWIKRFNWRSTAIVATTMILAGNLLTLTVKSYEALLIIRMLTGLFGEGIGFSLSIAAVSESEKPDRAFGFLIIVQVVAGAIGLIALPGLIAIWGMPPVLLYLALLALVVLPVLIWMPLASVKTRIVDPERITFPIYIPLIGLSALAIWCLNIGAYWSFVERIGDHSGVGAQTIGFALSLGMLASLVGGVAAAGAGDRYGRIWPFCLTLLVHAGIVYPLVTALTGIKLALIVISYNLAWNFGMPYLMGLIATSDSSARMAVLMPVSQSLGVGAGAAIAGILANQYGYPSISLFISGCCLLGMILFIPFSLRVVHGNWLSVKNSGLSVTSR